MLNLSPITFIFLWLKPVPRKQLPQHCYATHQTGERMNPWQLKIWHNNRLYWVDHDPSNVWIISKKNFIGTMRTIKKIETGTLTRSLRASLNDRLKKNVWWRNSLADENCQCIGIRIKSKHNIIICRNRMLIYHNLLCPKSRAMTQTKIVQNWNKF